MSSTNILSGQSDQVADLGRAIPDTAHAVSVSLPSWKANVGYEEGEEWVVSKMKNGYPRFFIHASINNFAKALLHKHGKEDEEMLLFPSTKIATRCKDFIRKHVSHEQYQPERKPSLPVLETRILNLVVKEMDRGYAGTARTATVLSGVIFPRNLLQLARKFWQHSGDGISSRRAEFFHTLFRDGHLVPQESTHTSDIATIAVQKGPRRYQKGDSTEFDNIRAVKEDKHTGGPVINDTDDHLQFVEERFGRNLDISLAKQAKIAIRKRIAGTIIPEIEPEDQTKTSDEFTKQESILADNVYLWPTGMSAIFNIHRIILETRGCFKSIMFGFPYIDTLKILEKFGPGVLLYGNGSSKDLDDLETRCKNGERFLALFCEFPGNPLLKTPDLDRIRNLANRFDFAVVVDETIGNFLNVNVLPLADIVVSSLTKVFSGDSNVMGGSSVFNSSGQYYQQLRDTLLWDYEDQYWPEDAVFMERNSRDFVSRNMRINQNAEALCQVLRSSPLVKELYYPKFSSTKSNYDARRNPEGGYGGLLSINFHSTNEAVTFFDALQTAKGPSLGTNFTLSSPYVILAHYNELEWAAQFGADADLIRVSVGLEDTSKLCAIFEAALGALKTYKSRS